MKKIIHPLKPIYNKDSEILILGSFPSIKSREAMFYYAHPQNRFWKILENIYQEEINDKTEFLLKHHIALWDVIKECEINQSSDNSIKNVQVNNLDEIINKTKIKKILLNGKTAYKLYIKYLKNNIDIDAFSLPSTSPANAVYSLTDLIEIYKKYLTE